LSDRARSGLTGDAAMSRNSKLTIAIATIWLTGMLAISAQDKYAVKVPNGLPFSDFKGYEDWQIVAVSQTDDLLKAMVAKSHDDRRVQVRHSRQRKTFSGRLQDRQD
jgi:hypothetical protein